MHLGFRKNIKHHNFVNNNIDKSKKCNQHIRMISEGSCDTEAWRNGCWKYSFAITGINNIFK